MISKIIATRDFRDADMDVVSIHHGQMNVPQFQYEYQVIVGIPSMLFRTSIVELHQFGVTGTLSLCNSLLKVHLNLMNIK